MELTEFDYEILLQLWIQANYYGYNVIEIPAYKASHFAEELEYYEDALESCLSLIETEKYLYTKGTEH